jgi:hypothetical protein
MKMEGVENFSRNDVFLMHKYNKHSLGIEMLSIFFRRGLFYSILLLISDSYRAV